MHALTLLLFTTSLLTPANPPVAEDPLRAAIIAAVSERMGAVRSVDVKIVNGAEHARPEGRAYVRGKLSATPPPGARLGKLIRFLVTASSGQPFPVVARVSVVAGHAVAATPVTRGESLTAADVEWTEGPLDGQLLQPLPALADVIGARVRRSIAKGEVLSTIVLARPIAVRAGDSVALTIRGGGLEVQGAARAVSSGSVGDVIRVTTPGSREIRRARITAPATVEMVR